jgi:hypothetical protein
MRTQLGVLAQNRAAQYADAKDIEPTVSKIEQMGMDR